MCPKPQETANLVTFTEEIFNEKLQFLCSVKVLSHSRRNLQLLKSSNNFFSLFVFTILFFSLWNQHVFFKLVVNISISCGTVSSNSMDTSLWIRHQFDIEFPRRKSIDILSIMKGESTWKEWHWFRCRFDVKQT